MNGKAVGEEQRLGRTQIRSDFIFIHHGHFRIGQRKKNNVASPHCLGCSENFKALAPRRRARFTFAIKTNDDGNATVAQVQRMRAALRAKTDHGACFFFEPAKIDIFICVNARSHKGGPAEPPMLTNQQTKSNRRARIAHSNSVRDRLVLS
jgi:hypothetical protein